ncbi:glycosyl transferase family 2 [Enterococcus faecium]|uniref:glycosyltransferase n=1 Tax=Enterococcus faecium TaxID=1352 RepID=UPI00100DABE2|nr:glycosyltransferase [Enterococcus faecium]RXW34759.1 glycosyl transferase family 2 [Enterococcus faecium]
MGNAPKISVIMSTYNEETKELSSAIDSILQQSYTDFEFIIIIDNPNNKNLLSTVEKYAEMDNRIHIISNKKNMGLAASLNIGLQEANGELIARMDADDISAKDRFERQIAHFLNHPSTDILSTNCFYIDEDGKLIGKKSEIPTTKEAIEKILPIGSSIIHPSVMGKKVAFLKMKGYRKLETAEDYDLWLRMLSAGIIIRSLPDYLLYYRIRKNSMTKSNVYRQIMTDIFIREDYKKRIKDESDVFSEKKYKKFITNNKQKQKFNYYYERFTLGVEKIQKNKFSLTGYGDVLSSLLMNKLVRYMFKMLLSYKVMVKKACGE